MELSTDKKRAVVALVAALVLALQSFGSAWAGGATFRQLDAFGNPLCISDKVQQEGQHPGEHAGFTECCTLACSGWTNPVLPPQDAMPLAEAPTGKAEPVRSFQPVSVSMRPDNTQGNPRAPPFRI